MQKIIHVKQTVIKANGRTGRRDPPLLAKTYKDNVPAHEIHLVRENVVLARILYRPDNPLSCGAKVWIDVSDDVDVVCIRNP